MNEKIMKLNWNFKILVEDRFLEHMTGMIDYGEVSNWPI
jgi:hypothetical protein